LNQLKWWQTAVFYQIYPRSFADANGDGIGDIRGMIEHLDYLKDLGIDAVWISPHYPSPQFDCGYDIADYSAVNPEYGSLDDFKEFLDGAHQRGIRVILDMVLNHTSDQHPWFIESRSSRDNPKRDWYIWHDGKNGGPPNNWNSMFDLQAWAYDETTGQYYYHFFFKEQPDLNWRNPEVKAAMWDAVRFWLDLGVDGYRLDALGTIFEDPALPDHSSKQSFLELAKESMAESMDPDVMEEKYKAIFQYQTDLPEVQDLMHELRVLVDSYPGRVLVGETEDIRYYGQADDGLQLVFNFPLMNTPRLDAACIRKNQKSRLAALPAFAWPCNTLGNHDSPRVKSRFSDGKHEEELARIWPALMLTLRGTPFLYNGEEIGMTNFQLENLDQVRDNVAHFYYQSAVGLGGMPPAEALKIALMNSRDICRTPMQWDGTPNAGFSSPGVTTWLPVNPNAARGINVAGQLQESSSLLNTYRSLLRLRKQTPALIEGTYLPLHEDAQEYVAFLRQSGRQTCLVVLNLSEKALSLSFDLETTRVRTLYATDPGTPQVSLLSSLAVAPFGVFIGELEAK
jgi:alpha-glucosidase